MVQRQLACSFNNEFSFFYMIAQMLEKYSLPTLNQLIRLMCTGVKTYTDKNKHLNKNNQNIIDKKVTVYNYKPFHTGQCLRRIAGGNVGLLLKTT